MQPKRSSRRDRTKSKQQVSTQPQSPERKAMPAAIEANKERDIVGGGPNKLHHIIKKEELGSKYEAFNPLCNSEGSFQTDTKVYSRASNTPIQVQNDRYSKDVKINIELSTVESQRLEVMHDLPSSTGGNKDKHCGQNTERSEAAPESATKRDKLVN